MPIRIEDIAGLALTAAEPATLRELLKAGKKLPPDATLLLAQDHDEAAALFLQHEAERDPGLKSFLAAKLCAALTVHALVEEEIFYPEAERALESGERVEAAFEEHGEIKEEIARVMEAAAAGERVKGDLEKLQHMVRHHVEEEESEMLPAMSRAAIDLHELGGRMAVRRTEALLELRQSISELEARV